MDDFVKVVKTIMKITQNNNIIVSEAEKLLTDLKKKLSDFLKEYPYELYFNFDYEFTRFSEFVKFPDFAERNIIGIGGKFSSGKSSFLNALLDEKILPVDTTPTTSIPTFIGNGKEFTVVLNIFNNLIEIDKTDLKNLKHYNSEEIEYSFSHLLKKIFIKTQQTEYKNLVFLDTPGYSKGEAEDYSENTDKKIAKVQLNNSNFIIWLVDADNGTISKEDIDFLKSLNREIEILIVVTKADKKQTEIDSILKYIKNEISLMGLNVIDVLPFSARKKNLFPIENIKKYIDKWNQNKINVLFAKNFKSFFIEISNLLNTEEEELRKELNKINIAKAYSDNNYVLNELNVLNKITINKLEQIKTQKSKLENFNLYFFDMIKKIGYLTNVNIEETYEPIKEIILIDSKITYTKDTIFNNIKFSFTENGKMICREGDYIFIDCEFNNPKFDFVKSETIEFNNCKIFGSDLFDNFTNFYVNNVINFKINNSIFKNINNTGSYICGFNNINTIEITNNKFFNCSVSGFYSYLIYIKNSNIISFKFNEFNICVSPESILNIKDVNSGKIEKNQFNNCSFKIKDIIIDDSPNIKRIF